MQLKLILIMFISCCYLKVIVSHMFSYVGCVFYCFNSFSRFKSTVHPKTLTSLKLLAIKWCWSKGVKCSVVLCGFGWRVCLVNISPYLPLFRNLYDHYLRSGNKGYCVYIHFFWKKDITQNICWILKRRGYIMCLGEREERLLFIVCLGKFIFMYIFYGG